MKPIKLMIVEDDEEMTTLCLSTEERYNILHKERQVEIIARKNLDEASVLIDSSFDGAIIDLKLGSDGDEGNKITKQINEKLLRIPIAIFTGTPGNADSEFAYVGIFKKGDIGYDGLFDRFWEIHDTGITRIMGGRGELEKHMNTIFTKTIMPNHKKWVEYGKENSERTERALLRHTLNHLLQILDDNKDLCFPEEAYLSPPLIESIQTGTIVKKKSDGQIFAVMTPACDLVVRSHGKFKTDRILLAEIDSISTITEKARTSACIEAGKKYKGDAEKRNTLINERVMSALKNNYCTYYHYMPKSISFDGGFLNFRKISTIDPNEINTLYEQLSLQIAPSFIKDVIARFSSYYARQGQPEIDIETILSSLTAVSPPAEAATPATPARRPRDQ
ncbi:MAG TPA: response regulator [Rhodospirillaceae bacterium]|nr:MAG: hypothetical protein A2018_05670 [Alphaproteobacteria bacterium GWF2_58_20]HAU29003.1 response regulator [Rhodospirillaceae bacterium]